MNLPSYTSRSNLDLIDSLYQQWKESPESIDVSWRAFFEGFELAQGRNGALKKFGHQCAALLRLPDIDGDPLLGKRNLKPGERPIPKRQRSANAQR